MKFGLSQYLATITMFVLLIVSIAAAAYVIYLIVKELRKYIK